LNARQHSPPGHRKEPEAPSVSTGSVHPQIMSAYNIILSYYDKHQAKRFLWQEAFASSKYRSSFSFAECERYNSPHHARLMAFAGFWWGEDFYSNNHQQPNGGIAHRSIT